MYVFIATIFIAEIIIAGFIIYWLRRFNRMVCATIKQVNLAEEMTISSIKQCRKVMKTAQNLMNNYINFFVKKKSEIRRKIINLVLVYLILIVFKTKFKRAAVILQYAILFKDFWNSIPA